MRKFFKLQSLILLAGAIFAWYSVYTDFARFYNFYGTITRVQHCVLPNPVTTPCFYGAIFFLIALVWSLLILKGKWAAPLESQKKLSILLLASTIFGWGNFLFGIFKFYFVKTGPKLSCSGVPTDNPFITPCFVGSTIFMAAFITSVFIYRRLRAQP
jgi:hypothetical protein